MFHFLWTVTLVTLVAASKKASNYTCPSYNNIRDDSVNATTFDINEYNGLWYMIATTEPTQPSFCVCGKNVVYIHKNESGAGGWYNYTNIANCKGIHMRVPIKGVLSSDPSSPGALKENFELMNHTVGGLDPNYIFHLDRDPTTKEIMRVYTYACLGRILGNNLFSYNILARKNNYTDVEIKNLVTLSTIGKSQYFDLSGIRYNNISTYNSC
eukprot:m.343071 g.343071  ORF g.343071 m.343071 type:complete len:212 (+) comp22312_c0_seq1:87-722(+)